MKPEHVSIIGFTIIFSFIFYEALRGHYKSAVHSIRDKAYIAFTALTGPIVTKPIIEITIAVTLGLILPQYANNLSHLPFLPVFIAAVLFEDFLHYWVHRASHSNISWLWKLHRTHHTGETMNTGLILRSSFFWGFCVPTTWVGASMLYFGLIEVYVGVMCVKILANVINHSPAFRYDNWMRKHDITRPVIAVLERIITTPKTHFIHHGYGQNGRPRSNYGTVFILWDIIFGTAYFAKGDPAKVGLPNTNKLSWGEELLYPIIRK